jgi:hypothetical protein
MKEDYQQAAEDLTWRAIERFSVTGLSVCFPDFISSFIKSFLVYGVIAMLAILWLLHNPSSILDLQCSNKKLIELI